MGGRDQNKPTGCVYGRTPIQRLHRQQVLGDSQLKLKLKLWENLTSSPQHHSKPGTMLRSLCRLAAHNKVVSCALRPTVQARPLETISALPRVSAIVSSQNLVCRYNTGVRQTTHLSLKGVSGFQPFNTKYGVIPILTNLGPLALPSTGATPSRSVVKWSWKKGKRKTVKTVLKRFKRLHWGTRGIWIRARAGAKKRMWKKSPAQRRRCKTHVFCNATQSLLLDKMVTRYWRRMRHYPDDPYAPYMKRENFKLTNGYPKEFY
ncbi:uncharacterized protein LOC123514217 isoform X2 [Portunus trituberculatus]|uniref:uncharacterized protein LOC123514217 isoform X2 n=1 Tax=Portunus trituberculatus TaxID=210409 RepID=UPI001E1CDEBE|nr:uncharacterized protein LOC123514217 isoform X2 [Portunus trituberculatus]